jgi:DNA-binding response OmpR family regulator
LSRDADRLQRIRMLERGSDDVVKKPFAYPELRARIAAVLRRTRSQPGTRIVRAGALLIDVRSRDVRVAEQRLALTTKEYELLLALASEPERVFTRQELLRGVWGYVTPTRTIDSHAARLRHKLAAAGERMVINVWGVGYRLMDSAPISDVVGAR